MGRTTRREFLQASGATVAAATMAGTAGLVSSRAGAAAEKRPERVLVVAMDSLRADHLGCYGYGRDTSPWIDALAAKSHQFGWAFSPSNTTLPSSAMLFTGRYTTQLADTWRDFKRIPEMVETLPEALGRAGFRSYVWSANGFLSERYGFGQGVEKIRTLVPHGTVEALLGEMAALVEAEYEPSGGPEFHYVHAVDAHYPYRPPYPYDRQFMEKGYTRSVVREGFIHDTDDKLVIGNQPYYSEKHDVQDADISFLMSLYDGTIRSSDALYPRLLEALRYDPARDLLVFTADHGEQFFEHGFYAHGKLGLTDEVRVPLIVSYAGWDSAVHEDQVSTLDLYPTLCELYGIEPPEGLVGTSLLPTLRGESQEPHTVVCESADWFGPHVSVIEDGYLYYLNARKHLLQPWGLLLTDERLHDLAEDPGCLENVASAQPEIADRMNARMRELYPRLDAFERSRLQLDPAAFTFGPDLCPRDGTGKIVWDLEGGAPAILQGNEDSMGFAIPARSAALAVPSRGMKGDLCIEFDYRLVAGDALLEIVREGEDQPVFSFEFIKHRPDWAPFQKAFWNTGGDCTVRFVLSSAGEMRIRNVRVRRLKGRVLLKPSPWPVIYEAEERVEDEVSDAEKARLEALGYL
ncbi:MAG: sulfatase-like hydrolase/transferase [bacterium]|nr:sulfatase-like hydrolase/transferase [bacterium]